MVFKVMVLDEVIQESVKLEEGDRGLSFGIFDVQRLKIGGEGISMENKKEWLVRLVNRKCVVFEIYEKGF